MAQSGIHAVIGYSFRYYIPNRKYFLPSVIIGAILPDLDLLIVGIKTIFLNTSFNTSIPDRYILHSFFSIIIIYLLFLILSEIKNSSFYKIIGKGIALGMLSHIIIDTFFWFQEIQFLWPLPFKPFMLWKLFNIPNWVYNTILILEFICFYFYAWFLISKHIENPNKYSWIIKYLGYWKFLQGLLSIFFIFLLYLKSSIFIIFFIFAYIPSIIISIWGTYMSRDALIIKK